MEQPLAKTSAIPRPGSKLPLLRPATSQLPRPASPEAKQLTSQAAKRQSIIRPPTAPSHRNNASVASSQSSTSQSPSKPAYSYGQRRQPLGPSSRPQSRHDSAVEQLSFEQHVVGHRAKGVRHSSQQENTFYITDSPEESDASTELSERVVVSPVQTTRRPPRPSLSDRTVESLSSIPPSPTVAGKRSSVFGLQSPTNVSRPSSRPVSSMGTGTLPRLNSNTGRANGFIRPPSPTKRPEGSGLPRTPGRRTISSTLPNPSRSATVSPHKRVESTPKASVRSVPTPATSRTLARPTGAQANTARARPMSMIGTPARASQIAPSLSLTPQVNGVPKAKRPVAAASRVPPPTAEVEDENTPQRIAKSSAGFRAQIAAAKAAHRATAIGSPSAAAVDNDFEACEDPFNQAGPAQSTLSKRIDAARRDGRLHIAALDLQQIPDEVLNMYEAEAMDASSVTWSETVDLTRLNAADNRIEELGPETFPDASYQELADGVDAKGNQFGGLERLDMHGNLLRVIPMGLRRLERLTTLNLTRNKLDNSVFSIVTQISCLRELRLGENELTREVPDSIGQLSNLEVLDLHSNKLAVLPGSIRNLVNLRVINLSGNRFAELPIGSIFSLPSLKEVYVATNALTGAFFPMTVDIVRSLQVLDISNNSLASISFGSELHLPAVHYLNISRNRLFALPNVSSWSNLITLLAEENSLTTLPDGLTSLMKLKVADFQRNSLRTVDAEIANMASLDSLLVAANPLREKRLLTMSTTDMKEAMAKKLELATATPTETLA